MAYNRELKCSVLTIAYAFEGGVGTVFMEEGNCTDMTGVIKLFRRIDKNVRLIYTFNGKAYDTAYVLEDGGWKAYCMRDELPVNLRVKVDRLALDTEETGTFH